MQLFTVIIVDGEVADMCEAYTSVLRFDGLQQEDADQLVRLSLQQGFQVALWQDGDSAIEEEGGGACGEA